MALSRGVPIAGVALALSAAVAAATPALAQTPIACNETIAASIDAPGESDAYTFFAEPGETLAIFGADTTVDPGRSGLRLELVAPDGSPIPYSYYFTQRHGPLAESGSYAIRVWNVLNQTGSYELTLVSTRLGGARCEPFPPIRCGETVSGEFESFEVVFRSFTAEAGDHVILSGSVLARLVTPDADSESIHAGFQEGRVPLAGTYTVAFGHVWPAPFHMTLETLWGSFNGGSNAAPTPICSAPPDGTRIIRCGETRSGAIDVGGDRDLYTFFAEAGDQVRVQVAPSSATSFWAYARIFGERAYQVYGHTHDRTVTIPANGAYWIEVSAFNGYDTGDYAVTLTRTPCASACSDGVDNDGDSLADFAADGGCTSADDLSERPECSDGLDNDIDGRTDFGQRDAGCVNRESTAEDPACDDGFDNDRDGGIDADGGGSGVVDTFCDTPTRALEHADASLGCGLGSELALLLPILAALRRRRR